MCGEGKVGGARNREVGGPRGSRRWRGEVSGACGHEGGTEGARTEVEARSAERAAVKRAEGVAGVGHKGAKGGASEGAHAECCRRGCGMGKLTQEGASARGGHRRGAQRRLVPKVRRCRWSAQP